jgi:Fe2+ or Zn2+ uptake regulation protein
MNTPKYSQIQKAILNLIVKENLSAGSKLPPERKLSEKFAASVITVRRALKELQDKGIIECRRGSGNFVKTKLTNQYDCGKIIYLGVDSMPPSPRNVSLIRKQLGKRGYNLQTLTTGPHPDDETIKNFSDASGIIACGWITREWVEFLNGLDIPALSIGSNPFEGIISRVTFNWRSAASKLTEYFIEKGAAKIGLIAGAPSYVPSQEMRTGYREAMKKHGLEYDPDMVLYPPGGKRYREIHDYLKKFNDFEALIVEAGSFNQLMLYFWQNNYKRPMLGFLTESGLLEKPIPNVVEVKFDTNIYIKGVETLFELIESGNSETVNIQVAPSLIC